MDLMDLMDLMDDMDLMHDVNHMNLMNGPLPAMARGRRSLALLLTLLCLLTPAARAANALFRVEDVPAYTPADATLPAAAAQFAALLKCGEEAKAFALAEGLSDKGDALGDFLLGWAAEHPPQGPRDLIKAEQHYRAGQRRQHVPCTVNLAALLLRQNAAGPQAGDLLRSVIGQDPRVAGLFLGFASLTGAAAGTASPREAAALWQKAGEAGSAAAFRHLGMLREGLYTFPEQRSLPEAAASYGKAVALGDMESAARLGALYAQAPAELHHTAAEARALFDKVEAGGDASALYLLGQSHALGATGHGVDAAAARTLYEKAAALKYPPAMTTLGNLAVQQAQPGDAAAMAKGIAWYEKAAALDYAPACAFLGDITLPRQGGGKTADKEGKAEKAFGYFLRAALGGYAPSMRQVAEAYRSGRGAARDPYAAGLWFKRATEAGDSDAMISMAEMMLSGEGVPFNNQLLETLCQRGLSAGNPRAGLLLGRLAERGLTRDKSLPEALAYYRWAALRRSTATRRAADETEARRFAPAEAEARRLSAVCTPAQLAEADAFAKERLGK